MISKEELKVKSDKVADYYNRLHQVLKLPHNSLQSYRSYDIEATYHDIMTDASIDVHSEEHILDAGFGLGDFDHFLAKTTKSKITAISFSEVEVAFANKNYSDATNSARLVYSQADFHFLTDYFEPETFDRIIFIESFEHAYDKEKVLQDCFRLLKPDGKLFLKYNCTLIDQPESRKKTFEKMVRSETDSMLIFTQHSLPELLKIAFRNGFLPQLVKIPSLDCSDSHQFIAEGIQLCNEKMEGFNYQIPNFQTSQCYNILLKKFEG